MPSVKNPNKPSKNRLAARANKTRKQRQKESAAGRTVAGVVKSDLRRGARPGLLPTSGPRKPLSAKKQRKLERKMGYALQRKREAEGEVEMKDVSAEGGAKKTGAKGSKEGEEQMEIDIS